MKFSLTIVLLATFLCIAPARGDAEEGPRQAPSFDLESLQGEGSGKLGDALDKVVIIEFWATYCGWCRQTHPKLAAFAKAHKDSVVVFGITAQKKSRVLRYLRKHATGLRILHDPKARVTRAYRADKTPTLVVLDQRGVIRAWTQGGNKLKEVLRIAGDLVDDSSPSAASR